MRLLTDLLNYLKIKELYPPQKEALEPVLNGKNTLISNVTATEILNKDELKKLLIEQIENRVRWRESVINMINNGVNHFIEIGPGKVLSGLIKRINKDIKINSINNEIDIKGLNI